MPIDDGEGSGGACCDKLAGNALFRRVRPGGNEYREHRQSSSTPAAPLSLIVIFCAKLAALAILSPSVALPVRNGMLLTGAELKPGPLIQIKDDKLAPRYSSGNPHRLGALFRI